METRKTSGTAENPTHKQTTFRDIQIKVVILLLANISIPCRSPSTQNQSDFDLSRSLKVKSDGVIGLAIYGFLLMVNSNIGPNCSPLRYIRLLNLCDLDFDLKSGWPWIVKFKVTYILSGTRGVCYTYVCQYFISTVIYMSQKGLMQAGGVFRCPSGLSC